MRTLLPIAAFLFGLTAFAAVMASDSAEPDAPPTPAEVPEIEARPESAAVVAETQEFDPDEVKIELHEHSLTIANAARAALKRPVRGFRRDCSGYVSGALSSVDLRQGFGVPEQARVIDYWTAAEADGRIHHNPIPTVGDLAFFDNTHDRNSNGTMDDWRTHIAIVVDVEPDGTVVLAHKGSKFALIRMNLLHPSDRRSPDGVEWNSFLRRSGDRGNPLGMYKTAELWTGFASIGPT